MKQLTVLFIFASIVVVVSCEIQYKSQNFDNEKQLPGVETRTQRAKRDAREEMSDIKATCMRLRREAKPQFYPNFYTPPTKMTKEQMQELMRLQLKIQMAEISQGIIANMK